MNASIRTRRVNTGRKPITGIRRNAKPFKAQSAVRMRKNPTPAERKLGNALWDKRPVWRRQRILLGYIVDFHCPKKRVVVEVDGGYHNTPEQRAHDERRDKILTERLGLKILRFTNEQILSGLRGVLAEIEHVCSQRPTFRSWNQGLGRRETQRVSRSSSMQLTPGTRAGEPPGPRPGKVARKGDGAGETLKPAVNHAAVERPARVALNGSASPETGARKGATPGDRASL